MSPTAVSEPPPIRKPAVTPYDLIGGEADIQRLVGAFYDLMERDPDFAELRALHQGDLGPMRARLADFLTQWMGGPAVFAQRHPGRGCIVSAHKPFPIGARVADQWLACMRQAFEVANVSSPVRQMLDPAFAAMCQGLRNDKPA
jgi:hemoglobin